MSEAGVTPERGHGLGSEPLGARWELARAAPGAHEGPGGLDALDWVAATVPGTAAGGLLDAGVALPADLDEHEWWWRCRVPGPPSCSGERLILRFLGIATLSEVWLNSDPLLASASMFEAHAVDVTDRWGDDNVIVIRCLALAEHLGRGRKPRARWRTRLAHSELRWHRTMLLGRAPGFAPGPAVVGPWRPVLLERRCGVFAERPRLRSRVSGTDGVIDVSVRMGTTTGVPVPSARIVVDGPSGRHEGALSLRREGDSTVAEGALVVPDAERWWPHTHGTPALHEVHLHIDADGGPTAVALGRVGFRTLTPGPGPTHDLEADGLSLHVNGRPVFARGAVWTPVDPVRMTPDPAQLRATLELARDAGLNLIRVVGTAAYESAEFHDLCDELGLLVWQDLMFANFDYPFADEDFARRVGTEVEAEIAASAHRPSLAVVCGGSEVEQQAAMFGVDPELARSSFIYEEVPRIMADLLCDAAFVPSAPCGGVLPFRPDRGVANYFGVGGYRRPLEDARRAQVRFASECLAFANVPDDAALEALDPAAPLGVMVHHPRWKAGTPRDAGTGWDFDDVRDHYLAVVFGVDPVGLRSIDHDRYLELSRAVTGEVMAEVFGEWRRVASPCGGGIVLWLRDLVPGAGWGLLDHRGQPKVALYHLRRALAPVAVWITDEGLGGLRVHVANETPDLLESRLRVAVYRHGEQLAEQAGEDLVLEARGAAERDVEGMLGHFVDAAWAYRFGPPAHDVVVATLQDGPEDAPRILAQAFHFPAGRPLATETRATLGLEARALHAGGRAAVALVSRRLAYGVRVRIPGYVPADDAFCLEPGVERVVTLQGEGPVEGTVAAINLDGSVRVAPAAEAAP